MIHYCNVNSLKIGATTAKKLGTEDDYYFPETENFLSSNIEHPLSLLVSKIVHLCNDEIPSITISEEETIFLKNYIMSLLVRNIPFQKAVKDNLTFAQFLPDEAIRSFSIQYALHNSQKSENPFCNYNIGIISILNQSTRRSLVVPRNGFYMTDFLDNGSLVVAPISPNSAVCLCDSQSFFHVIDDDKSVDYLNMKAYFYEKHLSGGFIATNSKQELLHMNLLVEAISQN